MKSTYEKPSERKKRVQTENIIRIKKLQKLKNRYSIIKMRGLKMPSGKVKWFNAKKGYGFITDDKTQKDIFLHVSALENSKLRVLKEDQIIDLLAFGCGGRI